LKSGTKIFLVFLLGFAACHQVGAAFLTNQSNLIRVPEDHLTIQAAIDSANPNDRVYVSAGVYQESITIEQDGLKIFGENLGSIIDLDGGQIQVIGNEVTICGFTIRNARSPNFAVKIRANSTTVSNNLFENNYGSVQGGVFLGPTVENCVIAYNEIRDSIRYGIFLRSCTASLVIGNTFFRNDWGITLYGSRSNVITQNRIIETNNLCLNLNNSTYNVLSENYIESGKLGVYVDFQSNHNALVGNTIRNIDGQGIWVFNSFFNSLNDNTVSNNTIGIYLEYATGAVLNRNSMHSNDYNFGVRGGSIAHFMHQVSSTNEVDGKHVYYLVNQSNLEINPSTAPNAGFVAVINSTNVKVHGLNLTGNLHGALLVSVSDSTISHLQTSKNYVGIDVLNSSNNRITYNTIKGNAYGIRLVGTENLVFKNNFLINERQATSSMPNTWDNGAEGNYWSDYAGIDQDQDGIGESPYTIDEGDEDRLPLVKPVRDSWTFTAGTWNDTAFHVSVTSQSTLAAFSFNQTLRAIRFNVTGPISQLGFCNVSIPLALLRGPYDLWADNASEPFLETSNSTHTFLHFSFNHTAKNILVEGTEAIPEFRFLAALLSLCIATAVVALKARCSRRI
jgi:parallel beta-helix repeat protein